MKTEIIPLYTVGRELYNMGISYHSSGDFVEFKKGKRKKIGNFFMSDKLTDKQKDALLQTFPSVSVKVARPQYAPEISRGLIVFPIGKIKKQIFS